MKKRILSIVLSIMMLISLLPTTAMAANIAEAVTVAGTTLSEAGYYGVSDLSIKKDSAPTSDANGYVHWDPSASPRPTLTLYRANIAGGISCSGDIIIVLQGTNTLDNNSETAIIVPNGSVTIKGPGSLTATGSNDGIYAEYTVSITEGATVNVTGRGEGSGGYGIINDPNTDKVSIEGGSIVTISGATYGIGCKGDGGAAPAINNANVKIEGGTAAFQYAPEVSGAYQWRTSDNGEFTLSTTTAFSDSSADYVEIVPYTPTLSNGTLLTSTDPITRAQMAEMVYEHASLKTSIDLMAAGAAPEFTDIENCTDDQQAAIIALYKARIISGTSATTFNPDDPVTRGEFAVVLWRATGCRSNKTAMNGTFTDLQPGDWYAPAVNCLYGADLLSGNNNDTFAGNDNILVVAVNAFLSAYATNKESFITKTNPGATTRAEMTEEFYEKFQKELSKIEVIDGREWGENGPFTDLTGCTQAQITAIQFFYERGIISGTTETTFHPHTPVSNLMIATLLHRCATAVVTPAVYSRLRSVAPDPVAFLSAQGLDMTAAVSNPNAPALTTTLTAWRDGLVPNAPTFTPAAGTFTESQSVELASTSENAAIYYTTDGSDPTTSNTRTLYAEAFNVTETTTVKAIAVKNNLISQLSTATYTKQAPAAAVNSTTGSSYPTATAALLAAQPYETVALLANCGEDLTIPAGVTFDGGSYTVSGTVTNNGTLSGSGIYNGSVVNEGGTINGGIFYARVSNGLNSTKASLIQNGTFRGKVINYSNGTIIGGSFQYAPAPSTHAAAVDNSGYIAGGTYDSTVDNLSGSSVASATFKGDTTFRGGSTVAGGTYEKPVNIDSDTSNGIITVTAGKFNGSEAGILYPGGVLDLSGVNPETFSVTIQSVYWGLDTNNVPVGTTNTGSNCIVLRTDMAAYRGNAEVSTINQSDNAVTVIKKREAPTPVEVPTIGTNLSTDEVTYVKDATATALNIIASVTDDGTLTYQWYKNDEASTDGAQAIDGKTGASYTPATSAAGTTYYYCVITNTKDGQNATATSAIAMITVNEPALTTYTVTYDPNGATSGSVPTDSNNYNSNATVTVLDNTGNLAKTNYTFAGWNTQAGGNGTNYAVGETFTISANTTLYAQWTLDEGEKEAAVDDTAAGSYADTTVSGWGDLATKDAAGNPYAPNVVVEVKLTVTAKTENTAPEAEVTAIKNAASGKTLQFLDLTLSKTVNGNPISDFGSSNNQVLEIKIPFTVGNKQNIAVYRYHGSSASAFDPLNTRPASAWEDGKFHVDSINNAIYIYAKQFSTYAIGYTVPAPTPTPNPPIYVPAVHDCTSKCDICGGCKDAKCTYSACKDKCLLLGMNFTDVADGKWYTEAVEYVYHHKMMEGIGNDIFDISGTTTRAMIVTILWRLEGEPVVNYLMQFDDISAETWYTEAVRWAASEKIVEGWNGKFDPMGEITREQFATILWRYAKYKGYDVSVGEDTNILSYEDAFSISEYAIPAMQWACGAGLMQGDGVNLTPKADATRAQAAALFQRFCENVAEK